MTTSLYGQPPADLPIWARLRLGRLADFAAVTGWTEPDPGLIRIDLTGGATVYVRRDTAPEA
jgi:hypothetical protein